MQPKVKIAEVCPRDGLQNVGVFVPTPDKFALIASLIKAGLQEIQIGSFVSPKAMPQFADIEKLAVLLCREFPPELFCALVANERGALATLEGGIVKLVFVFSVSEAHNLKNVQRRRVLSISALARIAAQIRATKAAATIRADIATVFGCPWAGKIDIAEILRCLEAVATLGIMEATLCDTIGMANPHLVESVLNACRHEFPEMRLRLHLHNTRGLALANILKAYEMGVTDFDAALGGLGGCPFAPGASGNIATEDVVFMFSEMGVATGVELSRLFAATRLLKKILPQAPIASAVFGADGSTCEK